MGFEPVSDPRVWRTVRRMYMTAGLLFLVNILLGYANILRSPTIPRAQILAHLHAGSVGWVTFSVMATAVWIFTNSRQVSESYAKGVSWLATLATVGFAGYVVAFYTAFGWGGNYRMLMPVFGITSALAIWLTFGYVAMQWRKQEPLTTPHLLTGGALLIGSIGALMGVLLGLELALSQTIIDALDRVGAHAGPMDTYVLISALAVLEVGRLSDGTKSCSKLGLSHAIIWTLSPIVLFIAMMTKIEPLIPISLLLLILGTILYLIRHAKAIFTTNPFRRGSNPGVFFAGIWIPVYVGIFVSLVPKFIAGEAITPWVIVVFVHVLFMGSATNAILVAQNRFSRHRNAVGSEAVPAAFWLINVGMILFFVAEWQLEVAHGAAIMGIGAIIGILAMMARMKVSPDQSAH